MKTINAIKSQAWDKLGEKGWAGPIAVSMFAVLLSVAVNVYSLLFSTNNIYVTLGITFCLYVCIVYPFNMGLKIYMLKFIRGGETSVGDVFDGYRFAIGMIPYAVISMGISWVLNVTVELAGTGNILMTLAGLIIFVIAFIVSISVDFSLYLIYDNNGKTISSLIAILKFMFRGGIGKYIRLILSFILWFAGILISFGMLTFFVYPYMEASKAVLYEEIYKFLRSEQ